MSFDEFKIESGHTSGIKWSMVRLPKQGEMECGDTHLIKEFEHKTLIAAIDGLGHGKSASYASVRTKHLLETFDNDSIINLMNSCHKQLRSTRGVVMSLALIDSFEQTITWIGVGNVKGVLLPGENAEKNTPESIILRHGIVGDNLPSLQASILPITEGDLLIFATDGVQGNYLDKISVEEEPENIVTHIAENHFKKSDDALILAARFVGEQNDVQTE